MRKIAKSCNSVGEKCEIVRDGGRVEGSNDRVEGKYKLGRGEGDKH